MKVSLSRTQLTDYIVSQINHFYPDRSVSTGEIRSYVEHALERVDYCFSKVKNKYFRQGNEVVFNHLHTDQYSVFLYFLCNSIFSISKNEDLAARVYGLNKALHSIDVFYEVVLPDIFYLQHPLGTVLGRAHYSDYLFVYPRCNVGANLDDVYPRIGEGVIMYGGSSIIGDCEIGNNCWLSIGSTVMDRNVPSNSVVFGSSPENVIKPTNRSVITDMFLVDDNYG